jgi:hypothetical protein
MNEWLKRIVGSALTVLGVAGLDVSAARAQSPAAARARFQMGVNRFFPPSNGVVASFIGARPNPRAIQAVTPGNRFFPGAGGALAANRLAGGLLDSAALSGGFGGYGGYDGSGMYVDSGGALYGAASIMNAQGQFKVSRQQARWSAEQVRTAQSDNKRRAFDEYMYELHSTPSPEQVREEAARSQLSRSLTDPDPTEIASATALNSILGALEGMPGPADPKTSPPLSEDLLKRVNVVKGAGAGLGLLRDEGRLAFPSALKEMPPAGATGELLKKLDTLARDAYAQASTGRVDFELVKQMQEISTTLNDRLTKLVNETPFQQYADAKRFLRALDDAIAVLRQPEAGEFLPTGRNAPKDRNAAELVKYMGGRGLRFAPATAGDEDAYTTLHRALANYHKSLSADAAAVAASAEAAKEGEK